ncbi:hypothetical protein [Actinoplanes sp. TFC3]|nr:hypothetical protein [Actinoplanes sp. TFC3]
MVRCLRRRAALLTSPSDAGALTQQGQDVLRTALLTLVEAGHL